MNKAILLAAFCFLFTLFSTPKVYADADPSLVQKMDQLLVKEDQILKALDEIKKEIEVVKVRVTLNA